MLARGEHHLADRDHSLLADRFADHRERLLPDLAIRHDVIGIVEIELVDLLARHELVDLDRALALDRDRFQLFRLELEVLALADLVALDDVGRLDLVAGVGIDLAILDAMAGVLVELVEADLFALAGRGKERDRARDQGQLQIAFPIRTRGHGQLLDINTGDLTDITQTTFRIQGSGRFTAESTVALSICSRLPSRLDCIPEVIRQGRA